MKDHIAASFDREIKSSEGCFWEALTDRSSSLVIPGSEYSEDHSAPTKSPLLFESCSELQKPQTWNKKRIRTEYKKYLIQLLDLHNL